MVEEKRMTSAEVKYGIVTRMSEQLYKAGQEDRYFIFNDERGYMEMSLTDIKLEIEESYNEIYGGLMADNESNSMLRQVLMRVDKSVRWAEQVVALEDCVVSIHRPLNGEKHEIERITPTKDTGAAIRLPITLKRLQAAKVSDWTQWLNMDKENADAIQQILGAALFLRHQAQNLVFFIGRGAQGKSMLLSVIKGVFGSDLVSGLDIEDVTRRHVACGLLGKIFNISEELSTEKAINTKLVKRLVGGGVVSDDPKYMPRITFQPMATWLIAANQAPQMQEIEAALKRRLYFISFGEPIAEKDQRKDIVEHVLSECVDGFIRWVIEGACKYADNGFKVVVAEDIASKRDTFQQEEDVILSWLSDMDYDGRMPFSDMYKDYRPWAIDNGYGVLNKRNLGTRLKAHADDGLFGRTHVNGQVYYVFNEATNLGPNGEKILTMFSG